MTTALPGGTSHALSESERARITKWRKGAGVTANRLKIARLLALIDMLGPTIGEPALWLEMPIR